MQPRGIGWEGLSPSIFHLFARMTNVFCNAGRNCQLARDGAGIELKADSLSSIVATHCLRNASVSAIEGKMHRRGARRMWEHLVWESTLLSVAAVPVRLEMLRGVELININRFCALLSRSKWATCTPLQHSLTHQNVTMDMDVCKRFV